MDISIKPNKCKIYKNKITNTYHETNRFWKKSKEFNEAFEEVDNCIFVSQFKVETYYRGRSAAGIVLLDIITGLEYEMRISCFIEMVNNITLKNGVTPLARWSFNKQGTAISLCYVGALNEN